MAADLLSRPMLAAIVDEVSMPILLVSGSRVVYSNPSACHLRSRLNADYAISLDVLIRDHVETIAGPLAAGRVVTLLTARNGEPFYVHAKRLASVRSAEPLLLVTIRALAPDRDAFADRYGLTHREAQVVELVLRGYGNEDVSKTLGIRPSTAKKHMTNVFNKIGVDSRAQLISRLA